MRFFIFILFFIASCSIKDKFANNQPSPKKDVSSAFSKMDANKDDEISQEEFLNFKDQKKELFDSNYNYKGPILIFAYILLIIISMCSITYITTILKRIYFYLANLLKK
jgi:hypothetical protein